MKKGAASIGCIFVDDEPMGLNVLLSHAGKIPNLNVLGTFASGTEALTFLQSNEVDLVFLNIQMPDLSGLELAKILSPAIKIVFTTAFPEYAVAGFDLAVTDYLLKPVGFSRFLQAIDRTIANVANGSSGDNPDDYIFVKTGYDWSRITLSKLLYIEADGNYLTFYETDKRILTRMTLSEILEKLPNTAFVRIHKSFVIAISHIDKIEKHQITLADRALPVTATYRDAVLTRLT
jgi:two-component system LytT family response regulator